LWIVIRRRAIPSSLHFVEIALRIKEEFRMWVKNAKTQEVFEATVFDTKYAVELTQDYAERYMDEEHLIMEYDEEGRLIVESPLFNDFIETMESVQRFIRSYYSAKEDYFNGDLIDMAFDKIKDFVPVRKMEEEFEEALWEIEHSEEFHNSEE